ncbi:hypothetical protein A2363_03540 [Candidatus Gottesmanbacteria bacterium RIFOXYB1_FULL_47_11]|uniref:DUF5666 domain-containing protein n=1 Tax=Candidatus Gottesmanbacteria bacterium RIFOXYB1_FULL_47_11 TaxID=1798401 RepID=A0A1F6BFR2_9BACT|nr:MAG: hypothetical protein A2363_03540 [Candidatus Gottesmanbacteria bacterium RIFOXYB1_FULL_47_11]
MNKLIAVFAILFLTTSVYAATSTESATTPATNQKLDELKDRLASAATQLKQSQKRAIWGTVKTTSVSTITVETKTSDVKIELTDTIKVAQIIKGERTDLTTDDLAKGDTVAVFGDYDAALELLKAKVIFIQGAIPLRISGTITQSDKKNFTVTVATPEGQSYIVDIESTTKNTLWNKEDGTAKGAFSKLLVGDTVHVLGTQSKDKSRISAARVLDIGNTSGATPTPTPTPTKTASPSATVKTTPKPTP